MKRPNEITEELIKGNLCEECGIDLAKHVIDISCPMIERKEEKKEN